MPNRATGHPSERFRPAGNIEAGVALKDMIDRPLVGLIAESFAAVVPGFPKAKFGKQALDGLAPLGLVDRAKHIARVLADHLPENFPDAAPLLIASLGPELSQTEGNGLAPFFYLPHVHYVAEFGAADFASGMTANYELTKRFSAEFSIRPFLVQHRDKTLKRLEKWTRDKNPHVRRLVSEGTRPLLPWAMRLREFQQNPQLALPLLERLKDDTEQYVRRSVANHLGDILKDHPAVVYDLCERWIEEIAAPRFSVEQAGHRRWMIRHAVRLPAKKGEKKALQLRKSAAIR